PSILLSSCCHVLLTLPATSHIYALSLHDALPICRASLNSCAPNAWANINLVRVSPVARARIRRPRLSAAATVRKRPSHAGQRHRSEEHTSELQSPDHLVCRLLLEKKNNKTQITTH